MGLKAIAKAVLVRGSKTFAISFIGAATTGVTIFQQQVFRPDGTLNVKTALAAASTAFLIAFATSVLHLLERSLDACSESPTPSAPVQGPPTNLQK